MRRLVDDDRGNVTWRDIVAKEVARIELTGIEGDVVTAGIAAGLEADPNPSQVPAKALVTTGIILVDDRECIFNPLVGQDWVCTSEE
jgi:hypothetical protein